MGPPGLSVSRFVRFQWWVLAVGACHFASGTPSIFFQLSLRCGTFVPFIFKLYYDQYKGMVPIRHLALTY